MKHRNQSKRARRPLTVAQTVQILRAYMGGLKVKTT
jgi:hypothetical protein